MRLEMGAFARYYRVVDATQALLQKMQEDIPSKYRFCEKGQWFVHSDYVQALQQLADAMGDAAPAKLSTSIEDDFARLHLLPTAPLVIVEAAWKVLARDAHPDRGGDEELFKVLADAYSRLKRALEK